MAEAPISTTASPLQGIRGAFWDCIADPFYRDAVDSVRFIRDGLLVLEQGRKLMEGPAAEVARDPRIRQAYLGGAAAVPA